MTNATGSADGLTYRHKQPYIFSLYNFSIYLDFRISSSHAQLDEATRVEQENLDIKCLQLLRAIIHNEVVKLPDDWEENPLKHKRYSLE